MSISNRDRLADEIREEARAYSGRDVSDLSQKIGRDLGIDDLDFYDFLANLSRRYGVDLMKSLETRAPRDVKPWSLRSIIQAFRHPGVIEDPTLARLVELIDQHRQTRARS